jgi:hypothetical protein
MSTMKASDGPYDGAIGIGIPIVIVPAVLNHFHDQENNRQMNTDG